MKVNTELGMSPYRTTDVYLGHYVRLFHGNKRTKEYNIRGMSRKIRRDVLTENMHRRGNHVREIESGTKTSKERRM